MDRYTKEKKNDLGVNLIKYIEDLYNENDTLLIKKS